MSVERNPEVFVCGHGLFQLQLSEQGSAYIRVSAHKFVSNGLLMLCTYEPEATRYYGS